MDSIIYKIKYANFNIYLLYNINIFYLLNIIVFLSAGIITQ